MSRFFIRDDFCLNVSVNTPFGGFLSCSLTDFASVVVDGLAEIDPTVSMNSPKNQAIGLLQAVRYLKGTSTVRCRHRICTHRTVSVSVGPLIIINVLIILLELLLGG